MIPQVEPFTPNVAVVIPRTGPRSRWGALVPDNLLNRPNVHFFDDQANPNLSLDIARSIVRSGKYEIVFGHFSSKAALPASALYERYGITAVFPLSSAPEILSLANANGSSSIVVMPNDRNQDSLIMSTMASYSNPSSPIPELRNAFFDASGLADLKSYFGTFSTETGTHAIGIKAPSDVVVSCQQEIKQIAARVSQIILSDDSWPYRDFWIQTIGPLKVSFITTDPPPERLIHDLLNSVVTYGRTLLFDQASWIDQFVRDTSWSVVAGTEVISK